MKTESVKSTVYFAKWILSPNFDVINDGVIKVTGNTISYIGKRSGLKRGSNDRVVNLGSKLLLPGFINIHTHLEESVLRGKLDFENKSFLFNLNKKKKLLQSAGPSDIRESVGLSVKELLANGITTVVDSTSTDLPPFVLDKFPIRSWTIHEFDLTGNQDEKSIKSRVEQRIKYSKKTLNKGVAPYAVFSLRREEHNYLTKFATLNKLLWGCHVGESFEEFQAFTMHIGDIFNKIENNVGWPYGSVGRDSLFYAITNNIIPKGAHLYHCNNVAIEELALLRARNVFVVISPQNDNLYGHRRFPLDSAINRKVNMCVCTESPITSSVMSLFDELYEIKIRYPHIPTTELLKWVTLNPARALNMKDKLGVLKEGAFADIIGITFHMQPKNVIEELIEEEQTVDFVMVNGEEIFA